MALSLQFVEALLASRPFCLLAAAAVWCGGFVAFGLMLGPLTRLEGGIAGVFLSSVVYMAAAFASIWILQRGGFRRWQAVVMLGLGVAVNLLADHLMAGTVSRMIVTLSIIAGGFGLGSLIAAMVDSPRYVVPIGFVASLADIWSVLSGPTKSIMESKHREYVMRHAFVSQPPSGEQIQPIAGAADLVFVALFVCIAARLGLSVRRSMLGMFGGLAIGLAAAMLLGGIPGLPFIAGGFIAANWREVQPGRSELLRTALFAGVMAGVLALITIARK